MKKKSFGTLIQKIKEHNDLKQKLSNNNFINHLDSKKRNAIAHFSYFLKDSKIWLCANGIFDESPEDVKFYDLYKETITINILSIALYLIFQDKFIKQDG